MEKVFKTLMLKKQDKVAIALTEIPKDTVVEVNCQDQTITVELTEDISFAHKFAVAPMKKGEDIIKYGEVIGVATKNIVKGEHVHVHNLDGKRGRGDKIAKGQTA